MSQNTTPTRQTNSTKRNRDRLDALPQREWLACDTDDRSVGMTITPIDVDNPDASVIIDSPPTLVLRGEHDDRCHEHTTPQSDPHGPRTDWYQYQIRGHRVDVHHMQDSDGERVIIAVGGHANMPWDSGDLTAPYQHSASVDRDRVIDALETNRDSTDEEWRLCGTSLKPHRTDDAWRYPEYDHELCPERLLENPDASVDDISPTDDSQWVDYVDFYAGCERPECAYRIDYSG